MKDLLGDEVKEPLVVVSRQGRKRKAGPPKRRGYAAPPGTGPKGETCKTCEHKVHSGTSDKKFSKCALRRATWNHSYGTDILARAPACRFWEKKT